MSKSYTFMIKAKIGYSLIIKSQPIRKKSMPRYWVIAPLAASPTHNFDVVWAHDLEQQVIVSFALEDTV